MTTMIEIKPGPELDAAVAKACGIAFTKANRGGDASDWWIIRSPREFDGASASGQRWSPFTDLNAAFEAAEKYGLFKPKNDAIIILMQWDTGWVIRRQLKTQWGGMWSPVETSRETIGEGTTVALAICSAILYLEQSA